MDLNVLFIGDVVGEPGLKIVEEKLGEIKEQRNADFTIVNGENSCDGKGITDAEATRIFEAGADVITTGNHVWDNWRSKPLLSKNRNVLRPLNYPPGNAGLGYSFYNVGSLSVAVLHLQGRTFMQTIDCPFRSADGALKNISDRARIVLVDFHAEATAEKYAMAWHLDGRVAAIFGTHTHIPTADAQIMPKGTAFITDVGMTGPYDSVVGLKKEVAIKRFLYQSPHKYEQAENDARICGASVVVETETGLAKSIESFVFPDFRKKDDLA